MMIERRAILLPLWAAVAKGLAGLPQEHKHDAERSPLFRVETNLVSLDVTVTDRNGKAIDGLHKEDFVIQENQVEQDLVFFTHEQRAVSWGIILDRSGSMAGMMDEVYNAALHSIEAGTRQDEAFIMAFDHLVEIVQDFTSDRKLLVRAIKDIAAGGTTALYDAVGLGGDHIRRGKHQKKVLVVVTDGDDNASHIRFDRLLDMVRQSETLVYIVAFFSPVEADIFSLLGNQIKEELKRLADETGGMAYFPKDMKECDNVCRDIAVQVSRQYNLGYYPKDTDWNGRWRDIRVAVPGLENALVRARTGYFARHNTV